MTPSMRGESSGDPTPIVVGAAFDGTVAPSLNGHAIEGLELESTYIWGLVRTRGEEPHIVQILRRLSHVSAWPPRLLLQSNFGVSGMRRHYIELLSARSRDVERRPGGAGLWLIAEAQDGAQPFELAITAGRVEWSEGQLLEVSGTEVVPGLQWCLLPHDDLVGMRYASRIFRVEGTFEGTDVEGFMGVDEVHLPPGRQHYVDDPMSSQLAEASCSWATVYDDGSVECGHVAFGADDFGFALRAGGGEAHIAQRVIGEVIAVHDGCPARFTVDIDGEMWEYVADDRGVPTEPLPGPLRQSEGWFRRVGEERRPVVWFATPGIPATSSV